VTSDDLIIEIKRLMADGISQRSIAKQLGINRQRVAALLGSLLMQCEVCAATYWANKSRQPRKTCSSECARKLQSDASKRVAQQRQSFTKPTKSSLQNVWYEDAKVGRV
jgi:hypothetical protein